MHCISGNVRISPNGAIQSSKLIFIIYFQSGSKKEAERLVKNIIKIVIKIGILHRNNQFNADEAAIAERFRVKFNVNTSYKRYEQKHIQHTMQNMQ